MLKIKTLWMNSSIYNLDSGAALICMVAAINFSIWLIAPDVSYKFVLVPFIFVLFLIGLTATLNYITHKASLFSSPTTNDHCMRVTNHKMEYALLSDINVGDHILVREGDTIPFDGKVVSGLAVVDESALTGESAPVVREASEDRGHVTAGAKILRHHLTIEVQKLTADSFLSQARTFLNLWKSPRQISDRKCDLHLVGLLFVFTAILIFTSRNALPLGINVSRALTFALLQTPLLYLSVRSSLLVGAMLSAVKQNVIPKNLQSLLNLSEVSLLALDKTGTLTVGSRQATQFYSLGDTELIKVAQLAQLASLSDNTPEGRSVVILAKNLFGLRAEAVREMDAEFIPFTSESQLSGISILDPAAGIGVRQTIFKGSLKAIMKIAEPSQYTSELQKCVLTIVEAGGTALLVAQGSKIVGAICLMDRVKTDLRQQLSLIQMVGIKTLVLTGDSSLNAETLVRALNIDAVIGDATPAKKLQVVRDMQRRGEVVAMIGDGSNDAPAMAQADVGYALNSGSYAAREASNIVDLESSMSNFFNLLVNMKRFRNLLLNLKQVLIVFCILALFPLMIFQSIGMESLISITLIEILLLTALLVHAYFQLGLNISKVGRRENASRAP